MKSVSDIRNLDYECYLNAVNEQRNHQEDWLKNGYAPKGFYVKDFCIIKVGDTYHLFHIAGTPGVCCCLPGNELWFGHATTKDFLTWETHEPCFYFDPNSWDNGHVFAPYVIEKDHQYWMFYTGVSIENTQRIGAAISEDLFHWKRVSDKPLFEPGKFAWAFCPMEKGAPCRDPHVCKFGDEYSLYYTAVTREGLGCVARVRSNDLVHWKDEGPVFITNRIDHCESSNVQGLNGKYLLFFGGHYEYWSYVISDNPCHWQQQEPIPLKKGITAMEVVARKDQQWLVAYFKMNNYRLFLGFIDWTEKKPTIVDIRNKKLLNKIERARVSN